MNRTKLISLWLATYPITNIYLSPIPLFSWGDLLFMFLLLLNAKKQGHSIFYYPKMYIWFWIYLAITFFISSLKQGLSIGSLFPGGVAFFIFSLQLGFCSNKFSINLLYKYSRYLAIITIVVLLFQELSFYLTGNRFSAIIPFFNMTDGKTARDLISIQMQLDRSCSIFREPAHVAQFLIIPLILDLFLVNKGSFISKFAIFLILGFLVTKSGNGLLALSLILFIKILQFNKIHNGVRSKIFLIMMLLIGTLVFSYYVQTEVGSKTLARTSEFEKSESSKSYIRIYRGFDLYSGFTLKNKVFGINNPDAVFEQTKISYYSYLFSGEKEEDLYFNCISRILIFSGIIGFTLFNLITLALARYNSILGRVLLLIFILLSFIGQIYLTPLMLIIFVVSTQYQYKLIRRIENENSVLY